jgi:hypothetical protein
MNTTTETLRASFEDPTKAIQMLTTFGFTGADRFAELNVSAGLAALDNSTHHFSTLSSAKKLDDLIELQIQSLLPAAESAKAYVGQMVTLWVATSRGFERLVESQILSCQNMVFNELYAGLTNAEESGVLEAKTIKETLNVARESALSAQEAIRRVVFDSLNLPGTKTDDDMSDVIAKPTKRVRSFASAVKPE